MDKRPRLTKEDLDAAFSAKQEKNRLRRETKVTREDIEKRLEERKATRADRAVPGQRARIVSLGLGIALLVGSGALSVTTMASTDAFKLTTHANEQQIAAAQGALNSIPAADEDAAATYSAELDAQIADATAKGTEVASLQQAFTTILFQGNAEAAADGAASAAFQNSVEHRRLLAPYFIERALFVDEALAYAPGSSLPFDADEIDPRFPWYVGYEPGTKGRTVADPAVSSWELVSVVATRTPGVLDATWLNKSPATQDLNAWATATYYVDPGAFGDLSVGQTTIGERGNPSLNADGV